MPSPSTSKKRGVGMSFPRSFLDVRVLLLTKREICRQHEHHTRGTRTRSC